MDEALAWARRGAISCDAAGEVRELLSTRLRIKDPVEASKPSGTQDLDGF